MKIINGWYEWVPNNNCDISWLDLHQIVEQGGIREGTDSRETAGTPVFQLIDGLADDINKIRGFPKKLRERIEGNEQGILPSIAENFQKKHSS